MRHAGSDAPAGELGWLTDQQRALVARAEERLRAQPLADLVAEMVGTPSPTGQERAVVDRVARRLRAAGLPARLLHEGDEDGSLLAHLPAAGAGAAAPLLLYAPIDTHPTDDPAVGVRRAGARSRPDMRPRATVRGDLVLGLGACNPKGHAAAVIAAATALHEAGTPLRRPVLLGLGGRGMPVGDPRTDPSAGHGKGCAQVCAAAGEIGAAVVAKPGAVLWEEVGLAIIRVRVHGDVDYVGVRHRGDHRNPVVAAAEVVRGLEAWFGEYASRHSAGTVAPQGAVGAIRAGRLDAPTFTPGVCDLAVDLRLSPHIPADQALGEFGQAIDRLRDADPGLDVDWEPVVIVPGTRTDPASPVVRSCIRSWESVTGERYTPPDAKSGATDANILRGRGIPTARVGMPRVPSDRLPVPDDFSAGMNVVSLEEVGRLARVLLRCAVDLCA